MKGRWYVGLLMVVVVIVVVAFSATTFHAKAQDMSPVTPVAFPPPYGAPATLPAPPSYQPLAPASEPSLPDLIAKLRELRKQEEQLTKTIKLKIMAQKKSLEEAEKEMNSLGIEATEHSPAPSTSSDSDKTTAPKPDKLPAPSSTDK